MLTWGVGQIPEVTARSSRHTEAVAPIDSSGLRAAIGKTWPQLTRDLDQLPKAVQDPKWDTGPQPVYVPSSLNLSEVSEKLKRRLSREAYGSIHLKQLPSEPCEITEHGLLYQPGPYVVPGGRFNELYGWDSWFIARGLWVGDRCELALSMLEQIAFQIEHYGMVLNANRTYYLTRSQPPLFTRMALDADCMSPCPTRLERMCKLAIRYYATWMSYPRFHPATGMSKYRDFGHGPAPEVLASERDAEGRTHYDRVGTYLSELHSQGRNISHLYCDGQLTELAYLGDRSMRESGFDTSERFGPLSLEIPRMLPVCLNVFLYVMELDIGQMYCRLGQGEQAAWWQEKAERRAQKMGELFFCPESGLYLDYDLSIGARSQYSYLTAFLPLWAGLSSNRQAQQVRDRLPVFERAGGVVASPYVTGCQWDAPFAWAPLQLFVVIGLDRYGFTDDAHRVASKFVAMVQENFEKEGVLREKYDAENGALVEGQLKYGYSSNEVGFGWTNAVVLELLEYLEQGRFRLKPPADYLQSALG